MFPIENIYIENNSTKSIITKNITSSSKNSKITYIDSSKEILSEILKSHDPISKGKRTLLITENKGSFLKKCPGTKKMICCNYYFLNFATNCPLDCSYCIIQEYLGNNPILKIFSNTEDMLSEAELIIGANQNKHFRIGTGELTDSLALDNITGFSKIIVPFFAGKQNVILELKTKTDCIENLMDLDHGGKTVIAWSLNPQKIINCEELYSASLERRIESAACCQGKGYKIAFHFDPIILYEGWETDYNEIVKKIFNAIDSKSILWISLGGLRFSPQLKPIISERFAQNNILYGELILSSDNKMRYFKPLRVDAFKKMVSYIKNYNADVPIYLCMEDQDIWEKVFGATPDRIKNLNNIFEINS